MQTVSRTFIIICCFKLLFGCSTLSDFRKSNNADSKIESLGPVVVSTPGANYPTLSPIDRQSWVQMSESKEGGRNRLNGLLGVGKWQEASEEARRELEKKPGDQATLISLAAAYALGKNYEMAGYYAGTILKTNPSNADALNLVGLRIMMGAGNRRTDFDEAIRVFKSATDNDGTHVAASLNMGYLLLDLGDAATALESFSTAVNRCGTCFDAEYGYGLASMRAENWERAKATFESILKKDNSRASAQYQLALTMNRGLNDQKRAQQLMQELVSDPDGRFKNYGELKRAANITLRRWRASDRTGPVPEETIQPPSAPASR